MSIPCPFCGSVLSIEEVYRGWIRAYCHAPCPVQIHAKSEQVLKKALENKEWVDENRKLYK